MELDAKSLALAQAQLGLLTRSQLAAAGLKKELIKTRIKRCAWTAVLPGVYAVSSAPVTWEQKVMATALRTEGVIVGPAAARLFEVDGFTGKDATDRIDVISKFDRRDDSYLLHLGEEVPKEFRTRRLDVIPVCNPYWLLLTLGKFSSRNHVEVACDCFVRRNQATWAKLRELVTRHLKRGRDGPFVLDEVLRLRGPDFKTTDSPLETWLLQLIRDCGRLPLPQLQLEIRRNGKYVATADLAYPDQRVVIDTDGREFHSKAWHLTRDARRSNALALAVEEGYRILHFTKTQIRDEPLPTLRTIADAIGVPWQDEWVVQERKGGPGLLRDAPDSHRPVSATPPKPPPRAAPASTGALPCGGSPAESSAA